MAQHRPLAKPLVSLLLSALVIALGLGVWLSQRTRLPEGLAMSNGRLEATEVHIASKYPGRLAEVLVDEGDAVSAGQVLARMDTRTLQAQLRQAEASVLQSQEGLHASQALEQQRQAEQRLARKELARIAELHKRGHASRQMLDQQQARFDSANAALAAAQAQIAAARASVLLAQAQVSQLQSELDDSTLLAPMNALVQLRLAEPGEVLGAGGRVLLLLKQDDRFMNLYLPANVVGQLKVGDEARMLLDALPKQPLKARISYVAPKAQFTPKEVETRSERQKLVFRVKLRLDQPAPAQLKAGMPGNGYVRTAEVAWPVHLQ